MYNGGKGEALLRRLYCESDMLSNDENSENFIKINLLRYFVCIRRLSLFCWMLTASFWIFLCFLTWFLVHYNEYLFWIVTLPHYSYIELKGESWGHSYLLYYIFLLDHIDLREQKFNVVNKFFINYFNKCFTTNENKKYILLDILYFVIFMILIGCPEKEMWWQYHLLFLGKYAITIVLRDSYMNR